MPTANARKGSETERMVAKYLREQGFWMADRRLREGRQDDQGDIDGVPFTTIQVKYVKENRYQEWISDTLKQRDAAGTPICLLVRRTPRKPVEQWEALMPDPRPELPENEAWTWHRMDLRLAVVHLDEMVTAQRRIHLGQSLPTISTVPPTISMAEAPASVRYTASDEPA